MKICQYCRIPPVGRCGLDSCSSG